MKLEALKTQVAALTTAVVALLGETVSPQAAKLFAKVDHETLARWHETRDQEVTSKEGTKLVKFEGDLRQAIEKAHAHQAKHGLTPRMT